MLAQFETAGLVTRHRFEGGQSFYEPKPAQHHDHLLCTRCGRIEEFVDEFIEERQSAIARQAGYDMLSHSHYLYGLCPACRGQG